MELLVCGFAIFFLIDILFFLLLSGKTIWQASTVRTANTQDLQVADLKMGLELQQSDLSTVTNNTGATPPGFSFLSAVNDKGTFVTDVTGAPVWQKYVIYCVQTGTTRLMRQEILLTNLFPLGIPSSIPLLSSAQISSSCNGSGTMLSSAVTSLSLQTNYNTFLNMNLGSGLGVGDTVNLGASTKAVYLSLTLARTNAHGKLDSQSRGITIYMRNSGLL